MPLFDSLSNASPAENRKAESLRVRAFEIAYPGLEYTTRQEIDGTLHYEKVIFHTGEKPSEEQMVADLASALVEAENEGATVEMVTIPRKEYDALRGKAAELSKISK